jgi:hypothetical protein
MLNPLARHKSSRSHDITSRETSDFEGSLPTDADGYIGKRKSHFFFVLFYFEVNNHQ